ncbi:MAG: helix-turn-helix domain-containing protein [Solobacterium sp.]|nr:helix-turn-helix domain-containing protein [Solobacterium sp.]
MISYEPLWKTMEQRKITQYRLIQEGIDNKTLHKLRQNKNITLRTLEKICIILRCKPNDVIKFTKEK